MKYRIHCCFGPYFALICAFFLKQIFNTFLTLFFSVFCPVSNRSFVLSRFFFLSQTKVFTLEISETLISYTSISKLFFCDMDKTVGFKEQ